MPSGQDARHHRHWQSVLYRVSGLRLTTLPLPLPDSGTVLGGSLELHGKTISLACFHGVNFRSKSWALFSLKEPYINFTSEVQEVPGDRKLPDLSWIRRVGVSLFRDTSCVYIFVYNFFKDAFIYMSNFTFPPSLIPESSHPLIFLDLNISFPTFAILCLLTCILFLHTNIYLICLLSLYFFPSRSPARHTHCSESHLQSGGDGAHTRTARFHGHCLPHHPQHGLPATV